MAPHNWRQYPINLGSFGVVTRDEVGVPREPIRRSVPASTSRPVTQSIRERIATRMDREPAVDTWRPPPSQTRPVPTAPIQIAPRPAVVHQASAPVSPTSAPTAVVQPPPSQQGAVRVDPMAPTPSTPPPAIIREGEGGGRAAQADPEKYLTRPQERLLPVTESAVQLVKSGQPIPSSVQMEVQRSTATTITPPAWQKYAIWGGAALIPLVAILLLRQNKGGGLSGTSRRRPRRHRRGRR